MRTPIIYAMCGISGSGKSTVAKEMMRKDANLRLVGRDKIRELLFGYTEETIHTYYTKENLEQTEREVSIFQHNAIKNLLDQGKDVIVDNTLLRQKYINELIKNFSYCIIKFNLIDTDYDTCVKRDKERRRSVGEEVIKKQAGELKTLKQNFDFKTYTPEFTLIVQDESLPKAAIFDIDGTLAHHSSGRGPFDWHRVMEDTLSQPVFETYKAFKALDYKIIICTGREGTQQVIDDTQFWLANYGIEYDEFHNRLEKDYRPDFVIKEELWKNISERYNMVALLDDRQQVVDHARRLGLTVFQVQEGNF